MPDCGVCIRTYQVCWRALFDKGQPADEHSEPKLNPIDRSHAFPRPVIVDDLVPPGRKLLLCVSAHSDSEPVPAGLGEAHTARYRIFAPVAMARGSVSRT